LDAAIDTERHVATWPNAQRLTPEQPPGRDGVGEGSVRDQLVTVESDQVAFDHLAVREAIEPRRPE
jgi:hypothetical protein